MKRSLLKKISVVVVSSMLISTVSIIQPVFKASAATDVYKARFTELYNKLHDKNNGYFSSQGIPYHSIETLMAEAPDYGHETTSEAFSYYLWLEAMEDGFSGNSSSFNNAWDLMEKYMIPSSSDQLETSMSKYNASKPAGYVAEQATPNLYPSKLDSSAAVGSDPINNDLVSTYGTNLIYGMHWLLDTDNWYGFGTRSDGVTTPSFINTFQRGTQESTWETIPQPCWDTFKYGGKNGYLDLFVGDNSYAKQFKYSNAPDADARAVQATYDAALWLGNKSTSLTTDVSKASKMGDYLRYAMFDKYFRKIGSSSTAGTGYDACHYLISWYYAWGGALDGSWSWKEGCSTAHQGYQNPMTAWILSKDSTFKPKSQNGATDWGKSLTRQLEMLQWLQSSEGAIAGGCSNSKDGQYNTWPTGTSTFYGMGYQESPEYSDPNSNKWFGFQTWDMQRVAEYYYTTKDPVAKEILDKWVAWVKPLIKLNSDGTFAIPSNLSWTGTPDTYVPGQVPDNSKLHVTVDDYGTDLGVAGSLANTLLYYSAASGDTESKNIAKGLLDSIYSNYTDSKGVTAPETRADYSRFNDVVYVPTSFSGTMPNGDKIQSGSTFLSLRSKYKSDPDFPKVQSYLDGGSAPTFKYHRFWAQCEVAIADGLYSKLFGSTVAIAPTTATFDLNPEKQADINVAVTLNGDTLTGIYNGSTAIVKDQDYTVDANDNVTILKSYLAKQSKGKLELTFKLGESSDQTLTVTVINSAEPTVSSTISPTTATFDLNAAKQADIPVAVTLNGNTLTDIYNGTSALVKDQDYTVDADGNVTILKAYLAKQTAGTVTLTFKFSEGDDATLAISIIDTTGSIKVQMFNTGTSATTNTIAPHFYLVNTGKSSLDLSTVKIRYYYTSDGAQAQNFFCDWSPVGTGNVTGTFNKLSSATANADNYLEVGFTSGAGSLAPGAGIDIQTRIAKSDWSNYNQSNDYSFDSTDTSYTDWSKATGYKGGVLQWGVEPSGSSPTPPTPTQNNSSITPTSATFDKAEKADIPVTLTLNGNTFTGIYNGTQALDSTDYTVSGSTVTLSSAYLATLPTGNTTLTFKFSAGDDAALTVNVKDSSAVAAGGVKIQMFNGNTADSINGITPRFKISNTGSSAINLSDLTLRYYYTEDGSQSQSAWCDWSSAGSGNVTLNFVKASSAANADTYLETGFTSGAGTLAPGASIEVQVRFSKSDWSNYTQSNDYSFDAKDTGYADWNKITGYLDGKLQFGSEP